MKYTPLLIALLFPCSLIAQSKEENKTIKSQRKVIIRTVDGDNENEIVIDDLSSNPEAFEMEKLIESGKLPENVRKMLKQQEHIWDKLDLSIPKDGLKKGIIMDAFGDKHEIDFDRDFSINSMNLFGGKKDASFDKLWPQIAKGLERAGIDAEAIERAHDYAQAYASPHKKHMIGVQCREIDDVLRHQLGLEHGILVQEVFKDSPAKEAGIQKHDIILQADSAPLGKVTDLVDAVQAAGLEQAEIKLTVLRGGENQEISMKTQKRKSPEIKELHIKENHNTFNNAVKSLTDELQEDSETKPSLKRF